MCAVTVTLFTTLLAIFTMLLPRQFFHTLWLCSHLYLIVCETLYFSFLDYILVFHTISHIRQHYQIYTSDLQYFCNLPEFSYICDFKYQGPYSFTPIIQWYQAYRTLFDIFQFKRVLLSGKDSSHLGYHQITASFSQLSYENPM